MSKLSDLFEDRGKIIKKEDSFLIPSATNRLLINRRKKRVHLIAAGDVGATMVIGLRLLGGELIETIGIYDLNPSSAQRLEMEASQVRDSFWGREMPKVEVISKDQLFHCDVILFTAAKGVPPLSQQHVDVRMVQLAANSAIVKQVAAEAVAADFSGLFMILSDPVDPLCKVACLEGLLSDQIQGCGLGVMHSRACYISEQDGRFSSFPEEGRVFGPHGQDLIVANSIDHYNHALSLELTEKTIAASGQIRDLGFKPYIGPALSSGALTILDTLVGRWNYSSVYFGKGDEGAYLGVKNRRTPYGIQVEDINLPERLYDRTKCAYDNLRQLV